MSALFCEPQPYPGDTGAPLRIRQQSLQAPFSDDAKRCFAHADREAHDACQLHHINISVMWTYTVVMLSSFRVSGFYV